MNKTDHIHSILFCWLWLFFSPLALAGGTDYVGNLENQPFIGKSEKLRISIDAEVSKPRDVYFVIQTAKGWKKVAEKGARISEAGKYNVYFEMDDLKPGQYRIAIYITPRGKNWNHRVGNELSGSFTLVDQAVYKPEPVFATEDKITKITWPRQVGKEAHTLKVAYSVKAPRDLYVVLVNKAGKAITTITYAAEGSGEWTLPLTDLPSKIPAGEYTWASYLTKSDSAQAVSESYYLPFTLTNH